MPSRRTFSAEVEAGGVKELPVFERGETEEIGHHVVPAEPAHHDGVLAGHERVVALAVRERASDVPRREDVLRADDAEVRGDLDAAEGIERRRDLGREAARTHAAGPDDGGRVDALAGGEHDATAIDGRDAGPAPRFHAERAQRLQDDGARIRAEACADLLCPVDQDHRDRRILPEDPAQALGQLRGELEPGEAAACDDDRVARG
ncbi:hypothetical protein WME75_27895 [Sorangium sp. So ce1014]